MPLGSILAALFITSLHASVGLKPCLINSTIMNEQQCRSIFSPTPVAPAAPISLST